MKLPDRRLHERHLEKLGQFQHILELFPSALEELVAAKPDDHVAAT
ncbi:unnamed protein product [Symbiodinium necroappetens]|uniref:Uncharacterized protein n=1 Tax=Symbiodinium necroappetens TaxID=1628268 RepID=A0A812JYE1_9DINO|nr:unnamed protein product [Symbiodinium necroappetens]